MVPAEAAVRREEAALVKHRQDAVADRVDAGAGGEGVSDQGVQALDARGHSPGAHPGNLRDLTEGQASLDIRAVRALVGAAQVLVRGEVLVEAFHDVLRLEGGGALHGGGVGEVKGRGEGRTVGKARGGCNNQGASTHAARGDTDDAPRDASQLLSQDLQVIVGGVGGVCEAHSALSWPVVLP